MTNNVRDQYNQFADRYLEKRKNPASAFWNAEVEQPGVWKLLAPLLPGKSVLDAGCGFGELANTVTKHAASCKGFDISESMIKIGKTMYPHLDLRVANMEAIPFDNNSFDVAYSSLVLHYFKDLRIPLRELARVLRTGGFLIFSIHHPFAECTVESDDGHYTVERYFRNDRYEWNMAGMVLESYYHSLEEISSSLNDAGFSIQAITEPRPSIESEVVNPAAYKETRDYPKFCIFKAQKV